jgi:hypothetical protein
MRFGSFDRHGNDPEVIVRPIGTTIAYMLIGLGLLGCLVGFFPTSPSCKLSQPPICSTSTRDYTVGIVSAVVVMASVAVLLWSWRRQLNLRSSRSPTIQSRHGAGVPSEDAGTK